MKLIVITKALLILILLVALPYLVLSGKEVRDLNDNLTLFYVVASPAWMVIVCALGRWWLFCK